ncbi:MAG: amino acid adenylation domain-containing protein, partial [Chitinophagales bacterium]
MGGVGLARGYLNQAELTAEKFIANPFIEDEGSRLYKTGDLAYWLADGNLAFVGRIDDQVKVRGFRIELGEVENALLACSHIRDAVVVARDNPKRLVAYFVPQLDIELDDSSLIEQCRSSLTQLLPGYMVPSLFMAIDMIPLTTNGKVDRKALPAPDASIGQRDFRAPSSHIEESLSEIWKQLLKVERVSVSDNFFALGGHSLLAMQVVSALQKIELALDVQDLLSASTLEELALTIDKKNDVQGFVVPANEIVDTVTHIRVDMLPLFALIDDAELRQSDLDTLVSKIPGGRANIQDIYPLSPTQRGVFYHHIVSEGVDPYILSDLFVADDTEQFEGFMNALRFIFDRHDALRTSIFWRASSLPLQVVSREVDIPVEWLELEPGEDVLTHMQDLSSSGSGWIDIEKGPLFRLEVAKEELTDKHYVLIRHHHILSDNYSLRVMLRDIKAYQSGRANELPAPRPYREFVAHSLDQLIGNDASSYFSQMLSDVDEGTLPFNLSDVNGDGSRVHELAELVPDDVAGRIRLLSKELKISPAVLFHAAWSLVLSTCNGSDDVVFGTVLSGRLNSAQSMDNSFGMFINTLPMRVRLSAISALELIGQVNKGLRDLLMYEQTPLALAQSCSGVAAGSPLFNAFINFRLSITEHDIAGDLLENGVTSGVKGISFRERTNYPIGLSVDDLGQGYSLAAQVDCSIAPQRIINYMQQALSGLLTALEGDSSASVKELLVLPASESKQLVHELNQTATDYGPIKCIHQLFEQQVLSSPDSVAVVYEDKELTYGELNIRSNQLAHYLVSQAVGPDTLVGLCVERSLEMVIAILAILKAGGAYVPLDPTHPETRLSYMLTDSTVDLVLTQGHLASKLPSGEHKLVCLDDDSLWMNYAATNLDQDVALLKPTNLAYVIYTSGSTGQPKGVMIEHEALFNYLKFSNDRYYSKSSGGVVSLPIAFDATITTLLTPLIVGKKCVLISNGNEVADIVMALRQLSSDYVFKLTPAHLSILSTEFSDKKISENRHTFIVGGDALSYFFITDWLTVFFPNSIVINEYGPTETVVGCSVFEADRDFLSHRKMVEIGTPIANTELLVLDQGNRLLPMGAVGELHIGGAGLARGYLNLPDLTSQKFIANPYSTENGARLYKTGDLAHWLPDGNLAFIGRIDDQVKVRGFRIELGEIESTLLRLGDVQDTVVVASGEPKKLLAYLVPTSGQDLDDADFISRCRTSLALSLPDYMVPSLFMMLDEIPLTANGKVDRKALPAPSATAGLREYVAPSTDVERILCDIWAELLELERVGVTDNFFELGGHSLQAMQVIARLNQENLNVGIRDLISQPTLNDLALMVQAKNQQDRYSAAENLIPIDCDRVTLEMLPLLSLARTGGLVQDQLDLALSKMPGGAANVQDVYPLAPNQEGIFYHHMMSEGHDPYVLPNLFLSQNADEFKSFIDALELVIARHDVLRTAIVWRDLPLPLQVVLREVDLPVNWLEMNQGDDVRQIMEQRSQSGNHWLELEQAPLLNVEVARVAESDHHYLLLKFHHIISDHVGLEIIQREIKAYIDGNTGNLLTPLAYREFVAESLFRAQSDATDLFFHQLLSDVDEPTLPFGLADVRGDGERLTESDVSLSGELSLLIRSASKRLKISPAVLFHAAWSIVLGRCSGRDDVVFGTVLSGRLQAASEADNTVGMFINTLPLRVCLNDVSAEGLVLQVRKSLSDLLPHEQSSLSLAQNSSGIANGSPLFSSIFNYRHSAQLESVNDDVGVQLLQFNEQTNYPLALSVDDLGDGFTLNLQVDKTLSAERIANYMCVALDGLASDLMSGDEVSAAGRAEQLVTDLSVIPEAEQSYLLNQLNNTQSDYPTDQCIHQLFEQHAASTPESVAVVCDGLSLSYHELNERSNRLAHYLLSLGVKPDVLVGLCVDRTLQMVVGILAILKAGGAYVPLDPAYPEARLSYMFSDSEIDLLLTQSHLVERLPFNPSGLVLLEDDQVWSCYSSENLSNHQLGLTSSNLAYVIYTSGSSGQPKGVLVEHSNVVSLVCNVDYVPLSLSTVVMQLSSISFDAATFELWAGLLNGGRVVIQKDSLIDVTSLADFIEENSINTAWMTSGLFDQFATSNNRPLSSMTYLLVGGDVVNRGSVEQLQERNPALAIINGYGPTECTTFSCSYPINSGRGSVPIGKPLTNRRSFVLDHNLCLVPLGVIGELHIAGAGVARGYLNQAELTKEKFIANPFSQEAGARLYKTGDLVRWMPDGNLQFIGRNDDQVKLRGFRIELDEVRSSLLNVDGVRDAVVVVVDETRQLVAYVVAEPQADLGETVLTAQCRAHLESNLPAYMVPAFFLVLEEIPLTANGKIDRKALPTLDATIGQHEYVAPSTEVETLLCEVWQALLGVERVGVNDNFFELGGHSLLAMEVIAGLQEAGLFVDIRDLIGQPTLRDLAWTVKTKQQSNTYSAPENRIPFACDAITLEMLPLLSLSPSNDLTQEKLDLALATIPGGAANVQDIYPLAPNQEGIFYHHMMSEGHDPYVLPSLFSVDSAEHFARFMTAMQSVFIRHDALRTAIVWRELPQPLQVVLRDVELPLDWVELNHGEDASVIMQGRCAEANKWIDLEQAPLFRLEVAKSEQTGIHYVLIKFHHIISDHVGLDVIQHEIAAYINNRNESLAQPIAYREFVAQGLVARDSEASKRFFTKMLSDVDQPTLPFGLANTQRDGLGISEYTETIAEDLSRQIRLAAKKTQVSSAVLFHAAWSIVLSKYSAREDVVFGTVVSGRLQGTMGVADTVGMFINTLPLRVILIEASVGELITQVAKNLSELLPFEQASLAQIQRCSGLTS